jgi:hypothetical protein
MSMRRLVVHIGEVVVDAEAGADLRGLEAEVRAGIAAAVAAGRAPAFGRSAAVLEARGAGVRGLGGAIAGAAPRRRRP